VTWDDPARLLHVGMGVDKGGAVVDRVEPGEIDHGQHDAVRDVFLAPGGCLLVRADLFAELGGFDPSIIAMGEDLDLCWRAQVAGARVVVAPAARVRHLERLASGQRALPELALAELPARARAGARRAGDHRPATSRQRRRTALQALQRRHELRAVLVGYSRFHRLRVLPQMAALALGEVLIALLTGHRDRAVAVAHAWRWNFRHRRDVRAARAALQQHRRIPDGEVRRLQLHGSARLTAYARRAVTHGLQAAHIGEDHARYRGAEPLPGVAPLPVEGEEPEEHRPDLGLGARILTWVVVALVLLIGSRQLLGLGLPYVSGFLPMPSWSALLHRFVSGWQPTGLGTTDPTSPASVGLGVLGFVFGGSTAFVQKAIVLGCLPVGLIGMARLARPFGSTRGRVAATVAYAAVPVVYDAVALGRLDALLAYAAGPYVVARLARVSAVAPFVAPAHGSPGAGWRRSTWGQLLRLAVLEAAVCSLAPSVALVVLLAGVALAAGLVLTASPRGAAAAARVVAVAAGATAVSVALLAPWSIAVLSGPMRWSALLGAPAGAASAPTWPSLLRLAVGPIGDTPLAFGLVAAAGLSLLIGARRRLTWAGLAWVLVLASWVVTWADGRGWLGAVGAAPQLLLVPAACGVALSLGLGVAAFERDLAAYRFGWRQVLAVVAGAGAVVGLLPVLGAAGSGRWDLPATGFGEATAWMPARSPAGGFRVLWVGDPRVIPGGSWTLEPGVGYSLSEGGLPDATGAWPGGDPGAAGAVAQAVHLAEDHATVQLGQLLAPFAIRYVVVVDALAPVIPGFQSPVTVPRPSSLLRALENQTDLRVLGGQAGMEVFVDDQALSERAVHPLPVPLTPAGTPALNGWSPALPAAAPADTALHGTVPPGTLLVGRAPAADWELVPQLGSAVAAYRTFGYAATFDLPQGQTVTVQFRGSWSHGVEIAAEMAAWVLLLAFLAGRRRWLDWWWGPIAARRARHGGRPGGEASPPAGSRRDAAVPPPLLPPPPDAIGAVSTRQTP
jgi:hypothetical protein